MGVELVSLDTHGAAHISAGLRHATDSVTSMLRPFAIMWK